MVPEITVHELAQKLASQDGFILLDVREPDELALAKINDARLVVLPMSQLAQRGINALPASVRSQDADIYVICHHGSRSANVTGWLARGGWTRVFSVAGGIDAYARQIDDGVGQY